MVLAHDVFEDTEVLQLEGRVLDLLLAALKLGVLLPYELLSFQFLEDGGLFRAGCHSATGRKSC